MIETSTSTTNSLQNTMPPDSFSADDLGQEEQSFYAFIKNKLNAIIRKPSEATVAKILDYSKSV